MNNPPPQPPKAVRLPLAFDPAGLQADVAALGSAEWTAHFNTGYYNGDWSGVALRAAHSGRQSMYADSAVDSYTDTGLLQSCAHLRAVVESFHCPLRSVRLLRLTAGSVIREHQDYDLGYEAGEVRVHVPVLTNPLVKFYLDSRRIVMGEGECWYLDLHRPHRVQNGGGTDRVHLVIDCQLNDWLRDLIAQGAPEEGQECSLESFRRLVMTEPALLAGFQDTDAQPEFAEKLVRLGRQRGFDFMADDVVSALQSAKRAWMERRVP